MESAQLTERQTQALFGDIKALQRDMQEAVGQDAGSMVSWQCPVTWCRSSCPSCYFS